MSDKVQTSTPLEPISSWEENPLLHLERVALGFLQQLYGAAPRGYFHWDADDQLSDLSIHKNVPIAPDVVEKRPAIAVVRSGVQWAGIGLDQFRDMRLQTGELTHTDMISGNLTFNCLSRNDNEAVQLGWLTGRHVWILRRVLLKLGFHDIGQRINVGASSPPGAIIQGDTEAEITNVPVTVPFHFQWTETVGELGLAVLNSVEATLTATMADVQRFTNHAMAGGFGTGVRQVDGNPVQHQNIQGVINPPYVRSRRRTPLTTGPGGNRAEPPIRVTVKT